MSFGKGSNTTTQTTQTAPNAVAGELYNDVLGRARTVADTPYQSYSGEMVAPINAQQNLGIGNINSNAGFASPYIQQGADYASTAAMQISPADLQNYMSPYTQQVVDATSRQFQNTNAMQQQQVLGDAVSQGALGGSGPKIAQAILAGQQQQAQAPVIAGLYNQGYTQAMSNAMADRARMGNIATTIGNLGVAGQQSALTGAGAQVGAGTMQQQTQQQANTAAMTEFMRQQAYPFQTTQWLAGLGTGVGSQMGGTSTGMVTPPQPNPWAQWGGLGLAAAGMFLRDGGRVPEGVGNYDAGGGVPGMPYAGVASYVPMMNITKGEGPPKATIPKLPEQTGGNILKDATALAGGMQGRFAGVGGDQPLQLAGGFTPTAAGEMMLPTGANMAGALPPIYASGGFVPPDPNGIYLPKNYDDGGMVTQAGFGTGSIVPDYPERPVSGFADRAQPTMDAIASGEFDPQGRNYTAFEPRGPGVIAVNPATRSMALPPEIASGASRPPVAGFAEAPTDAMAYDGSLAGRPVSGFGVPAPPPPGAQGGEGAPGRGPQDRGGGLLNLSPAVRNGLIAAGLGMMASRSPNLGNALGEGGLQGLASYGATKKAELEERKTEYNMDHATKTLEQQAKHAAERLAQSSAELAERQRQHDTPSAYQTGVLEHQRRMDERNENKPVVVGNSLINPKTKEVIFKGTSGLFDDATVEAMAGQYLAGDKSVFQNLGRGAQGAENIVRLRAEVQRQAAEAGLKPDQVATKMADFAGRTAAMRTLGTRGANVEYAANTANRAIDLAEEAMGKVPRTQFVPFNQLIQLVETKRSSPEQAAFYAATNTLVNEYARVAAGGSAQATEGQRHHAREMLNTAMGPEAYKAVLNMMRREIVAAKAAYLDTRREFLSDHTEGHPAGHAPAGAPAGAPKAAPAAPAGGAPAAATAPAAAAAPPPAPPRAERQKIIYMTPKGPFRWNGEGWVNP